VGRRSGGVGGAGDRDDRSGEITHGKMVIESCSDSGEFGANSSLKNSAGRRLELTPHSLLCRIWEGG